MTDANTPKTIEDVLALLQQQQEGAAETQRVQAEQTKLRAVWGDKFQENFDTVAQHIMELPPEQQALYNNAEGAQFLKWQLDQQSSDSSTVPTLDASTAPSGQGTEPAHLKRSDLLGLSLDEYKTKLPEVMQAYGTGQVEKDVPMGW